MNGEILFRAADFDCRQIFTCGQCFRWKKDGEWWKGVAGGRFLKIRSGLPGGFIAAAGDVRDPGEESCGGGDSGAGAAAGEAGLGRFWRNYFDLDTDYGVIKEYLGGTDENLKKAAEYGSGIRLLRQEPFETLISFIISANNNIPRISKCIEALCRKYGRAIGVDPDNGETLYAFPESEALAALTPEEVSETCHAGYRCPYIVKAARQYIERGGDIDRPETYIGVGPKVAACVSLFTGKDFDSFPVDVWVRRLIGELYFSEPGEACPEGGPSVREVQDFVKEHFPKYGGYAQQYLFYWRRDTDKDKNQS
jgi:N-glycosylase/DNA lyase